MSRKFPPYYDAADLPEDERIGMMALAVQAGKSVGCVTDDDDEKVARYIRKMTAHPGVRHIKTSPGPVPHTKTIGFGPVLNA